MHATTAQSMCVARTNTTAATRFTVMASTFFVAFNRCRSSSTKMPSTAMRMIPCAAPK